MSGGPTRRRALQGWPGLASAIAALGLGVSSASATEPPPAPTLPDPTFQSVSEEVLIEMDDGVEIAATVARPSEDGTTPAGGTFPVVLGMTPYGRNGLCGCYEPEFWASRGMVGAVADVRGTGGSGGTLAGNYFSPREAKDGYNLVEYFGTRDYSTGKVGMAGGSYLGITQYLAAARQPPHLTAIAPQVAISDLYRDGFAHGGIPSLSFDLQYIGVQGAPGTAGTNTDPFLLQQSLLAKLGQSPPGSIAFDYLERPNDDPFYQARSPIEVADGIRVPVLDIGGWRDGLLRGETEMYDALAGRPDVETRLYMDPCTHKGCGAPLAPFTDPPDRHDTAAIVFEFLAKHLLDATTPERPPVELYLQGRNEYISADTWPPADATMKRFQLEPGLLRPSNRKQAVESDPTREYVTDPAAGFSLAFNKYGTVAATPYVPTDQRLEGAQGVTFRTPALADPLTLVGPAALRLAAASTANNTDWYAKLSDVGPDGSESLITEGALRASHRRLDPAKSRPDRPFHTHTDPQPIEPGRFYDYSIEIWPTAYELAPGHRLQVRVTSTDMPTHLPGTIRLDRDRPQDTRIDLLPPATNTVRLDGSSALLVTALGGCSVSTERGGDEPETLIGSPLSEELRPRGGDDTVRARGGDDCVRAGSGSDVGSGQGGDDLIRGHGGRDRLLGGTGSDVIRGNRGRDTIAGGPGDDALRGGAGKDRIAGGGGADRIDVRGGGPDRVRCGGGRDRVRAGGRDRVAGDCEQVTG